MNTLWHLINILFLHWQQKKKQLPQESFLPQCEKSLFALIFCIYLEILEIIIELKKV